MLPTSLENGPSQAQDYLYLQCCLVLWLLEGWTHVTGPWRLLMWAGAIWAGHSGILDTLSVYISASGLFKVPVIPLGNLVKM